MTNWIISFNNNNLKQPNGAIQLVTSSLSRSAMEIGFQELNYVAYQYTDSYPERRQDLIKTIFDPVQPGDLVALQFPMYVEQGFTYDFIDHLLGLENVKKVAVIIDVPTWMNSIDDDGYDATDDPWLERLKKFDLLIVANKNEARHLRQDGVDVPMISIEIGDYLYQGQLRPKKFQKKLYYVTGRDVLDLNYHAATPINLFSAVAKQPATENPSLTWHGHQPSDAIMATLDGGFGIVTTDNIVERFAKVWQYYTQFNNPTKLSFYLAAGLPVITMSRTPHAALIQDRHLGLVVDDLDQIDRVLANLKQSDYQEMLNAIVPWQQAITSGFFVQRALMAAIQTLNLGLKNQLITPPGPNYDNSIIRN